MTKPSFRGRFSPVIAIAATLALSACAQSPGQAGLVSGAANPVVAPAPVVPQNPATTATGQQPAGEQAFETWLVSFGDDAVRAGIRRDTVDRVLGGLTEDPSVIEKDRHQPETTLSFLAYLDRAVNRSRVAKAQAMLAEYREPLARVEATYGVDARFLVAFWGMETNFGSNMGKDNVFRSLATLAFDGRRADFFRTELLNALRMVDSGAAEPQQMIGSWAGAMGNFQFMPSTYLSYAVDMTGSGRKDIWNDTETAFASAANYLSRLGWQHGQPWGMAVRLPADFRWQMADVSIRKPLAAWAAAGVTAADGSPLPASGTGAILLPMGYRGPAFMVFDNFHVITAWNASLNYALAVGILADRIAGAPPYSGPRPADADPLQPQDVRTLQTLLSRLGSDVGAADGQIGKKTRAAVRTFQLQLGQPADGYPTADLLTALRARTLHL